MNELTTKPGELIALKWFYYSQNNSGGYFINNDMVAEDIFVQAPNAAEANVIAEQITAQSALEWCGCCGERWWIDASEKDGYDIPHVYAESILTYKGQYYHKEARLHFYDRRIGTWYYDRENKIEWT